MRSTPILLDRLRHIKYDLQAVWDMDYLMDGGFSYILDKDINFELCRFLLWSGLKSEDPCLTMEDTETLMKNAGVGNADGKLRDITLVCINELFSSGWLVRINIGDLEKAQIPLKDGVERTVQEFILDTVKLAHASGLIDDNTVWKYTPIEIGELYTHVTEVEQSRNIIRDYRMGTICSVILGAAGHKKSDGLPFAWSDFAPKEIKPQSAADMLNIITTTNALMGGDVL